MADLKLNDTNTYYDFTFLNGDFELTYELDTALLLSIFCEKRAASSEVPAPEMRRGWWGNTVLGYDNYEMGSKLWELEQARKDNTTLGLSKTYAADCLQWLIEDNYAVEIKVDSNFIVNGINLDVEIVISQNKTISESYELWEN
ncbi:MAG: phage GP46 family protein, partial [Candidatus Paceibacterota bacterium]